jgi:hypothetical protein
MVTDIPNYEHKIECTSYNCSTLEIITLILLHKNSIYVPKVETKLQTTSPLYSIIQLTSMNINTPQNQLKIYYEFSI